MKRDLYEYLSLKKKLIEIKEVQNKKLRMNYL